MNILEHTFASGIVSINYAEGPANGPPLVLLHGGSARWQSFQNIIPALAASWHLVAPDLRGHGRSGWVPNRYRLQDYVDDVIALLVGQVGEPAALFGHSLGGMVALMVAAQRPDLVRAIAIGDSPLTAESWGAVLDNSRDKLVAWSRLAGGQFPLVELVETLKNSPVEMPGKSELVPMRDVYGEDSSVFTWLATNLSHNDPDMLTALLNDFDNVVTGYNMDDIMPAIFCPVLLLQADPAYGGLMTNIEVDRARPLLDQLQHVQLSGVSHALHHEHEAPILAALVEFFEST